MTKEYTSTEHARAKRAGAGVSAGESFARHLEKQWPKIKADTTAGDDELRGLAKNFYGYAVRYAQAGSIRKARESMAQAERVARLCKA